MVSLEIQTQVIPQLTHIKDGHFLFNIRILNKGNEDVYMLYPIVTFLNWTTYSLPEKELPTAHEAGYSIKIPEKHLKLETIGAYFATVKIYFQDGNGKAYENFSVVKVIFQKDSQADLIDITAPELIYIQEEGKTKPYRFKITNHDLATYELNIYSNHANEIFCATEKRHIALESDDTMDLLFYVQNQEGMRGNTYLTYLILDYIYQEVHYFKAHPVKVQIL